MKELALWGVDALHMKLVFTGKQNENYKSCLSSEKKKPLKKQKGVYIATGNRNKYKTET